MRNVAVLTEDGAFALFFHPHPGGFHSSRVPMPGNFPPNAQGSAQGGWAHLELIDASGLGDRGNRLKNVLVIVEDCLRTSKH